MTNDVNRYAINGQKYLYLGHTEISLVSIMHAGCKKWSMALFRILRTYQTANILNTLSTENKKMLSKTDKQNRINAYNAFLNRLSNKTKTIAHFISYRTGKIIGKTAEELVHADIGIKHIFCNNTIKQIIDKDSDKYINYIGNYHHWTTAYCWNTVMPLICQQLNIMLKPEDFKLIPFIWNDCDFSYHENININKFKITDFISNKTYIGNNYILRNINDCPKLPYSYSMYHMLFKLAHSSGKISNETICSNSRLAINCDSMSIPIIPILAFLFKEILIIDNRTKQSKKYSDLILKFNPTHYLALFTEENFLYEIKQWANLK